jgi:hypothetical protein
MIRNRIKGRKITNVSQQEKIENNLQAVLRRKTVPVREKK